MAQATSNDWNVGRFLATAIVMAFVGFVGILAISLWAIVLRDLALTFLWTAPLSGAHEQIISTIGLGAATVMVATGYIVFSDNDRSYIDLHTPTLHDLAYSIAGLVALFTALELIARLYTTFGIDTAQHTTTEAAQTDPALLLPLIPLSILIIGPGEELLYRNIIQKTLYDHAPRWAAVTTASIIFALVHIPAYSTGDTTETLLATLLVVFTLSLILGTVYERTHNLLVPALVHGTYNAILFATDYLNATTTLIF